MTRSRWLNRTRRHPSAVPLVVQLAGLLLYSLIETTEAGWIGFGVFCIVAPGITPAMVRRTQWLAAVSVSVFTLLGWGLTYLFLLLQALQRAVSPPPCTRPASAT